MDKPTTFSTDAPDQRKSYQTTAAYYASFIALGLVAASLGPTLPDLAENTRSQLSSISFLFLANALGRLLGVFRGGRLYDKLAGHPIMAVMLVIIALMMALVPVTSILGILFLVLLIRGAAQGILDLGGNTLLVWVHGDKMGPFMNGLHFAFGVGAFLSPIIIAQVMLQGGGLVGTYWVLAILMLPVAVWLLRLPSPPAQTVAEDGSEGKIDNTLVVLISVFFFLYVGAEIGFAGWIFTYAVAVDLASATVAAYLTSAFFATLTIGRLLAIPIAVRFRPRTIMLSDLAGCIVSVLLIFLWQDSLIVLWAGTLGLGLSMASMFPTMLSIAERRITITGRVTGWFFVGASAGGMVVPWLIGQFFEEVGPQSVMTAVLFALILASGIFAILIRYSSRLQTGTV